MPFNIYSTSKNKVLSKQRNTVSYHYKYQSLATLIVMNF